MSLFFPSLRWLLQVQQLLCSCCCTLTGSLYYDCSFAYHYQMLSSLWLLLFVHTAVSAVRMDRMETRVKWTSDPETAIFFAGDGLQDDDQSLGRHSTHK